MSCYTCKCNLCARSCELSSKYFTPGEVSEACFNCDDCWQYDGDHSKRNGWRNSCEQYVLPQKFVELERKREDLRAKKAREKFIVIIGGASDCK